MRQICLIFLVDKSFDSLSPFAQAFERAGFQVEQIAIPYVWLFGRDYLARLKSLLALKTKEKPVIFNPQSAEMFLDHQGKTFVYSAYQCWFDKAKHRVIPHVWSPVKPPSDVMRIKWTDKPPLQVGFMGRDFGESRLANLALRVPRSVQDWVIQGHYVRHPYFLATLNDWGIPIKSLGAFPRIAALNVLERQQQNYPDITLDIVRKERFTGSDQELTDYIIHLESSTYVLCPRGTENYSYRMYEALCRGRVPVIIDTDMVLPKELNWPELSISVPYTSLEKICGIIRNDYESKSAEDFRIRQEQAIVTMRDLCSMRWIDRIAEGFPNAAADET